MKHSNKKNTFILFLAIALIGFSLGMIVNNNFTKKVEEPKEAVDQEKVLEEEIKLIKTSLVCMGDIYKHTEGERIGHIKSIYNDHLMTDIYIAKDLEDSFLANSWIVINNVSIVVDEFTEIIAYDFSKNIPDSLEKVNKTYLENVNELKEGDCIYVILHEDTTEETLNIRAKEIRTITF